MCLSFHCAGSLLMSLCVWLLLERLVPFFVCSVVWSFLHLGNGSVGMCALSLLHSSRSLVPR